MSKEKQNPNQLPETKGDPKESAPKKKSGAQVHKKGQNKSKKPVSAENAKPAKKPQPEEAKPAKKPQPEEAKPAKKPQPEEAKPAKKPQPEEAKPAKKPQPEEAKSAKKPQPEEAKPAKKPQPEEVKSAKKPQPEEAEPEKKAQAEKTAAPETDGAEESVPAAQEDKPAKKQPVQAEAGDKQKRVMDILLSLLLIGGIGAGAGYVVMNTESIDQNSTYVIEDTQPVDTTAPTEEGKTIYQTEMHENTDIYMGDLILVNTQNQYLGTEEGLVSLYEKKQELDNHSFSVRDGELLVREVVADQLIAMFDGFYNVTFDDNIVVQTGYRSVERQQELYDQDLELTGESFSERVSKPGHSEHQTGYCVDLSLVGGEDYDGTGVYEWVNEHCYEYGFVLRYEESKVPLTEVKAEPWHYRYVGVPHAFYMTSKGLCLEEYMMELKQYSYEGEHLMITAPDGTIYEVYYVAMDAAYDSTMVPVPGSLEYTVSGNNEDGFIVTVNTGETGEKPAAPTEAPTEETAEETTEVSDESEQDETEVSNESEEDSSSDEAEESEEDSEASADEAPDSAGESEADDASEDNT